MREIKFRVWDGKKMWMPETLTNDESQTNLTFFNPLRGIKWGLYDSRLENRVASGEHHQLMQYTGLKDKNGKEIYEGDILNFGYPVYGMDGEPDFLPLIVTIEFNGAAFWFAGGGYNDCNWHFYNAGNREIIGNIYDNPKLIK